MSEAITISKQAFPIVLSKDNVEHVKVADLCAHLGLAANGQRERLKKAPWATGKMILSVRKSGKSESFFCVPLRTVPMFFATLDASRVKPAFRDALIAMQVEAADAIADYYLKGGAIRAGAPPSQLLTLQEQIAMMLRAEPLADPVWPDRFVKRYEAWNGRAWRAGDRQPYSMQSANWFFYQMIFPAEVLPVIKTKGLEEGARYHQVLADAPRDYLVRELDFASKLADDCGSEREWRQRMRRAYRKTTPTLRGQGDLDL
jgi:hypothetical protein